MKTLRRLIAASLAFVALLTVVPAPPAGAAVDGGFFGSGYVVNGAISINGVLIGDAGPATATGPGTCVFYGNENAAGIGNLAGTCTSSGLTSAATACNFAWQRLVSVVLLTGKCGTQTVDGYWVLTPPVPGAVTVEGAFATRAGSS